MKGQSLIVQFILFFMIGLGLFTSIGGVFRLQSDLIREDVAKANRELIGSYVSSIVVSMNNCKGCNLTTYSIKLENVTTKTANYITILNLSSKGLQIFSEPAGGNTSVSIHLLNESLILSRNASSAVPIVLAFYKTSDTITMGVDFNAPVRSDGTPTGTITSTSATLFLATNEPATCRYSTSSSTAYNSMTNAFSTTDGITHRKSLSNLQSGQHNYYVRCKDIVGNVNTDDYTITFTVT